MDQEKVLEPGGPTGNLDSAVHQLSDFARFPMPGSSALERRVRISSLG